MEKRVLLSLLMGVFSFVLVSTLIAQPHPRHRNGPGGKKQPEQISTFSGSITEWTYNDDFVYDGLYLKTGETVLFVKFPSHLGQQIRSLGSNISVNGVLKYAPEGIRELKIVSISGKGQTVYDQKPAPRNVPQQEVFITGNAKVYQMQRNKKGETSGYILDNGVVLRIPPHVVYQLSQMVQVGSAIGYTGIEKELKDGQVQAKDYKIVRCQTISVNGTQYMVR